MEEKTKVGPEQNTMWTGQDSGVPGKTGFKPDDKTCSNNLPGRNTFNFALEEEKKSGISEKNNAEKKGSTFGLKRWLENKTQQTLA